MDPSQTQNISGLVETTLNSDVTDLQAPQSSLPSPTTCGTTKTKLTSIVWKDFDQIQELDPDDPQKKKMLKLPQCKLCGKKYSGDSKAGTSHLKRNFDSCLKKCQSTDQTHALLARTGS
ncbi:hypothetical protein MKX01_022925, partial [Papaver californicum]